MDHPLSIQEPMAEVEMVNAFKRAALEYQPELPAPTTIFFHILDNPNKVAVRLLFGGYEIEDPKRLKPFVELARARWLTYKVEFDLVEVVHNRELWLVDTEEVDDQPPTYNWISSTDEYLGISNRSTVEPDRTGPDPGAVASWRRASGDGDLIAEEGVKGPSQDH